MVDALQLAWKNLSWISGNAFLAWIPALVLWQVVGARGARRAAFVLVVVGVIAFELRVLVSSEVSDRSAWQLLLGPPIASLAAFWAWRARAGARWARGLGLLGAAAFLPNAPYVLTDGMHYLQDLRTVGDSGLGALVLAVQYGWFLAVGLAGYLAVLVLGRQLLEQHGLGRHAGVAAVLVVLASACGIYLGRIERWHSWHPVREPSRFARSIAHIWSDMHALGYVVAAVAVVGVVTAALWIVRPHERRLRSTSRAAALAAGAFAIVAPAAAAVTDVLRIDVGVAPMSASGATIAVIGGLLLARSGARGRATRGRPWLVMATAVLLAGAFVAISAGGWWAQYRGLCHLAPQGGYAIHGDRCPDP